MWLSGKESVWQCRRQGFDPCVRKIPYWRKWQHTPVFLPGKSQGQRSLVGYKESDTTEWMSILVRLSVTPWTIACQASLSMGFPRGEYWSGLPFPSPRDLPDPVIETVSPPLTSRFFITEPPGKPHHFWYLSHCVCGTEVTELLHREVNAIERRIYALHFLRQGGMPCL